MVYSLMYTLFLVRSLILVVCHALTSCLQGFGLQIGSEFFLVVNAGYRHRLAALSDEISGTVTILASFLIDNSTVQGGRAAVGTYQFTDTALGIRKYVVNGERPFLSGVNTADAHNIQVVIARQILLGICRPLRFGPSSSSSLLSL